MNVNKERILVTGGRGFIGRAIVEELLSLPQTCESNIYVLDTTLPTEQSEDYHERVTYIRADVTSKTHMRRAVNGMDALFHAASTRCQPWMSEESAYDVNVTGTINVIDAAREVGVRNFVFTSSAYVVMCYLGAWIDVDENQKYPSQYIDTYTAHKAEAERIVLAATTREFATVVLRPSIAFGLGDGVFADVYVKGEVQYFLGQGATLMDMVYIGDVAKAHVRAYERLLAAATRDTVSGQIYHIGQKDAVMHREFAGWRKHCWSKNNTQQSEVWSLPLFFARILVYVNESVAALTGMYPFSEHLTTNVLTYTQRSMILNTAKAERDLEYYPSRTVYESVDMVMKSVLKSTTRSRPAEQEHTRWEVSRAA
eukprot:CFRG7435T1